MNNTDKESLSRVLLITFIVMFLISHFIATDIEHFVLIYACFGFIPIIVLFLGVEKHRKFACIEMILTLLLILVVHHTDQKLRQKQIFELRSKIIEQRNQLESEQKDTTISTDVVDPTE